MTDRELMELAAKACGYDVSHHWNALRMRVNPPVAALCIDGVSTAWNPLDNDGDALRLAVKLATDNAMQLVWQGGIVQYGPACAAPIWNGEAGRPDPYAATRRAIVRAAAEIGKALP